MRRWFRGRSLREEEEEEGEVGEVVGEGMGEVVEEENRGGWRARWLVRLRRGRVRLVILVSAQPFSLFPFLGSVGGGLGGAGWF